jgi:hypothetical protein
MKGFYQYATRKQNYYIRQGFLLVVRRLTQGLGRLAFIISHFNTREASRQL